MLKIKFSLRLVVLSKSAPDTINFLYVSQIYTINPFSRELVAKIPPTAEQIRKTNCKMDLNIFKLNIHET